MSQDKPKEPQEADSHPMNAPLSVEKAKKRDHNPARTAGVPSVQCSATSKQSGQRCKRFVEPGFTTCRFHGGSSETPQVARAVQRRMQELAPKATNTLESVLDGDHQPSRVNAAKYIIERAAPSEVTKGQTGPTVVVGIKLGGQSETSQVNGSIAVEVVEVEDSDEQD